MNTDLLHRALTPARYAALHDAARAEAARLRNEAIGAAFDGLVRLGRRGRAALAARLMSWLRRPQALARSGGPAR